LWDPGARVLIGTSGYSFADWVGPFYPRGYAFGDMLPYYARHFPVVEVNSTYYRIPSPRTFEQMERRTPPGFRFIVKVHQVLTHERRVDTESIASFRACLEPLLAAGKLDGLLAQFPWSFKNTSWGRRYLVAVRRALPDAPLFVEFRHASWATEESWQLLRDHRIGYCVVDEPALRGLMPPVVELTSPLGYVRYHGRNADQWWGHSGADRYNYSYSEEELRDWLPRIGEMSAQAEKVYVFFNNCHAGQAAQNAQLMQQLLDEIRGTGRA
jgi:uncharacterized protein YecE (DUF72 family)